MLDVTAMVLDFDLTPGVTAEDIINKVCASFGGPFDGFALLMSPIRRLRLIISYDDLTSWESHGAALRVVLAVLADAGVKVAWSGAARSARLDGRTLHARSIVDWGRRAELSAGVERLTRDFGVDAVLEQIGEAHDLAPGLGSEPNDA